ncbi:hypothetical protein HY085_00455 [Candidatus Gottesmanbacteria bacterium]|nr:hypothetical protein [Candidatus Gottesmanbacteria bacterium]
MAVSFEVKKDERKRMSARDEVFSTVLGILVAAGGFWAVLQMWQSDSYIPPVEGRRVIQNTPLDISEFGLKPPIICVPKARQECS